MMPSSRSSLFLAAMSDDQSKVVGPSVSRSRGVLESSRNGRRRQQLLGYAARITQVPPTRPFSTMATRAPKAAGQGG